MAAGHSRSEQGVRNTQAAFLADARPDFPTDWANKLDPWKFTQRQRQSNAIAPSSRRRAIMRDSFSVYFPIQEVQESSSRVDKSAP